MARTSIRTQREYSTVVLKKGDRVRTTTRPEIPYIVVDRDRSMVKVKSEQDGSEMWVARSIVVRESPSDDSSDLSS